MPWRGELLVPGRFTQTGPIVGDERGGSDQLQHNTVPCLERLGGASFEHDDRLTILATAKSGHLHTRGMTIHADDPEGWFSDRLLSASATRDSCTNGGYRDQ